MVLARESVTLRLRRLPSAGRPRRARRAAAVPVLDSQYSVAIGSRPTGVVVWHDNVAWAARHRCLPWPSNSPQISVSMLLSSPLSASSSRRAASARPLASPRYPE